MGVLSIGHLLRVQTSAKQGLQQSVVTLSSRYAPFDLQNNAWTCHKNYRIVTRPSHHPLAIAFIVLFE